MSERPLPGLPRGALPRVPSEIRDKADHAYINSGHIDFAEGSFLWAMEAALEAVWDQVGAVWLRWAADRIDRDCALARPEDGSDDCSCATISAGLRALADRGAA